MSAPVRLAVAAIGVVAAITVIGACTQSGDGGASTSAAGSAAGGAAGFGPQRGPVGATPSPEAAKASHGTTLSASGGGRLTGRYAAVDLGGAKIRIVQMTVQVKRGASVAAQANAAEAIVAGAGGEVDADDRSSGRYAEATLVLKVPPAQLSPVLDQLSRLGIERSRQESTQDVTARVADVTSRVDSAQTEIARLRVLYQHARKISDVITIESELAQREGDLESLQAQQRALAAETTTATITLTLISPPPLVNPVVKAKHSHQNRGFLAGLEGGWHAFTGGLAVLAMVAGAVLPFAVLLLVLGLVGRLVLPRFGVRLRPRRSPAPAAPPQ